MFSRLKALLLGDPVKHISGKRHYVLTCPDCGCGDGQLHDLFCTKEQCPFCDGQLMSCDCIKSVLKLTPEEEKFVDDYIDDSVPPLSDIMQRWKHALNQKGRIPFRSFPDDPIRAAYRGDVAAIKDFIADGVSVITPNQVGYTALMAAARAENPEMLRVLLGVGAQATHADERGYNALHWAVAQSAGTFRPQNQTICVRLLLEHGVDPNSRSNDGTTPLMNAAWFGCIDATRELIKHGGSPAATDDKGRTAEILAAERGHGELKLILSTNKS